MPKYSGLMDLHCSHFVVHASRIDLHCGYFLSFLYLVDDRHCRSRKLIMMRKLQKLFELTSITSHRQGKALLSTPGYFFSQFIFTPRDTTSVNLTFL